MNPKDKTNTAIVILAIIAIILLGVAIFGAKNAMAPSSDTDGFGSSSSTPTMSEPMDPNQGSVVSNEVEAAIAKNVTEFGLRLKNVSLLAPAATVRTTMAKEYGPYLIPELLAKWQANPSSAIGKITSSPWPDRIQITGITPETDGTYRVNANVIEMTSSEKPGEIAGMYAVTLYIIPVKKETGQTYPIGSVEKGEYATIPKRVTVEGIWECLPVKDPSKPHTMECAFGIKEDKTSNHYAVNTQLMSTIAQDYPTGTHLRISGVMTPAEMLSTNQWQKFDMKGILNATTIEKIK